MEASAQPPQGQAAGGAVAPPAGGYAVKRGLGRVIIFTILSLGFYTFFWFFQTRKQISQQLGTNDNAGLQALGLIVPILNWFIIYWLWRDIDRADRSVGGNGFNVTLYIILLIIGGFLTGGIVTFVMYILVLVALNGFWDRRTNGTATSAPVTGSEIAWVVVPLVLYIVLIVVIVAAGSSSSGIILTS